MINVQADIARALLKAGATPKTRDNAGRTALLLAARGGMIGVIEELINHGDININEVCLMV